MKKLKTLFIFTTLIVCLIFAGCASKDTADIETDKGDVVTTDEKSSAPVEPADKPAEVKNEGKEKTTDKPIDDPATAALKAYAEATDSLYSAEFNKVFDKVKFMLADFSDDGQPELLAVGIYEDTLSYMEIYAYSDKKVSKIFEGQCGAANGINMYPIRYKGVAYVMKESISSATGFYQQLMHYNGTDWFNVHSSFVEFDFYNNGEKKGNIIDDAPASDAEYEELRTKVEESYMKLSEFSEAKKLK